LGSNARLAKLTGCFVTVALDVFPDAPSDDRPRKKSQPAPTTPSNTQSRMNRRTANSASILILGQQSDRAMNFCPTDDAKGTVERETTPLPQQQQSPLDQRMSRGRFFASQNPIAKAEQARIKGGVGAESRDLFGRGGCGNVRALTCGARPRRCSPRISSGSFRRLAGHKVSTSHVSERRRAPSALGRGQIQDG